MNYNMKAKPLKRNVLSLVYTAPTDTNQWQRVCRVLFSLTERV